MSLLLLSYVDVSMYALFIREDAEICLADIFIH